MGLRLDTASKHVKDALALMEKENDLNGSMAVKTTLRHLITTDMWLERERNHQAAKNAET